MIQFCTRVSHYKVRTTSRDNLNASSKTYKDNKRIFGSKLLGISDKKLEY